MNVSAFIRTFEGDFEWLEYCLRSLEKYGSQLLEVVVTVPASQFHSLTRRDLRRAIYQGVPVVCGNDYIDQQRSKSRADEYCKGDFILHLDSDCVAFKELDLAEFFEGGLPKLLFRKWEDAGSANVWQPITKGVLRRVPQFETMATHPTIYHRSTHELFRRHIEELHGLPFDDFMASQQSFSEFNAIGNFCHLYTPDAYRFVRCGPADGYPRPLKQHWSRGDIPRAQIEEMLK